MYNQIPFFEWNHLVATNTWSYFSFHIHLTFTTKLLCSKYRFKNKNNYIL